MQSVRAMVSRVFSNRKFTVSEAQVITGLTKRQINNLVDDLADIGIVQSGKRTRKIEYRGLFALPLSQELAEINIGPEIREAIIKNALAHPKKKYATVPNTNLSYTVKPIRDNIKQGLNTLYEAESYISKSNKIMQGEPCIRGTRISAYIIATIVKEHSVDEAIKVYPDLEESQINAACIYAKANPRQGRPKQIKVPSKNSKTVVKTIKKEKTRKIAKKQIS